MSIINNKLVFSFAETNRRIITNNSLLSKTVKSIQETDFYPEEESIEIPEWLQYSRNKDGLLKVIPTDTITTAIVSVINGIRNTTILNFANSLFPGGGVRRGVAAQEENICRCTNLYRVLKGKSNEQRYYDHNMEKINEYIGPIEFADDKLERIRLACAGSSSIIYTPNIYIIKRSEKLGDFMQTPIPVNVISCAAPDLNYAFDYMMDKKYISKIAQSDWYKNIMKDRCERILKVAIMKKTSTLILGAFGCGAFLNDPKVVATIFKELMTEYRQYFDYIIFPIPNENSTNFKTFKNILCE